MIGFTQFFSLFLAVFALALLLPVGVGILQGETDAAFWFAVIAAAIGFAAGSMFLAFRGRRRRSGRIGSYIFTVAVWCIPALLGALPLIAAAGLDPLSAVFESTSGYTTTGATVFAELAAVDQATILWRAELQWLGGLTTLLVISIVLAPGGIGGLPARQIGLLDPATPGGDYRLRAVIRDIATAYGAVTVACLLLLLIVGIPAFDAACLAFSTVSTGGFMPRDGNLAVYRNGAAEIILMIFMLAGATSVLWHRMLAGRRWQLLAEHRESYFVIAVALIVGFAFTFAFWRAAGYFTGMAPLTTLRHGLLAGISLVSTTGFVAGGMHWSLLPLTVVMLLALAGAGAFSTAGGLKYYRIGGMLVQARHELRRLIHPHGVRNSRFGSQPYGMTMMRAIWGHFFLSLLVIAFATLVVSLSGDELTSALTAALASFANVGPLHDVAWGTEPGWTAFAAMPGAVKLVLAGVMILGRFEVIAFFAALSVTYWRS
jgi:trk system potassium uptake protein TrkH